MCARLSEPLARTAWVDQERAAYGDTVYDISIPLNGHSRDNHFSGLTSEDKKFISSIWAAFRLWTVPQRADKRVADQTVQGLDGLG